MGGEIAAIVGSPFSATYAAPPAVSAWLIGTIPRWRRKCRDWPSACGWLYATLNGPLPIPISAWWIGMKYSPTIDSPLSGSRKWISATRPCCEFSIGMIAQPALPTRTASSASSKLKQGSGRHCGHASIAARCELAPGEPWKAIARSGAAAADSRMVSTIARAGAGKLCIVGPAICAEGTPQVSCAGCNRSCNQCPCAQRLARLERRAKSQPIHLLSGHTMNDRKNTAFGWILFSGIVALGLAYVSGQYFHEERPEEMGYAIAGA